VIRSNLIDKLDLITINNVGDNIQISNLDLSDDYVKKVNLINYSTNPLFFEIPTINLIHSFSQFNPNVKVLYLHTKGTSYKELSPLISDWIELLIYFNIGKHDTCLNELDEYDCIGCNYYLSPEKHFNGNFWWSKTDYICKLDRIKQLIRLYPEFWLCSNKYAKIKSLHNSYTDHYYYRYPPERYITE
jgi:hypothetical protein